MGTDAPPFDISRPNSHDSKAEFLQEKRTVSSALESAKPLIALILNGASTKGGPEHDSIRKVLKSDDASVRSNCRTDRLETVFDLTCSNASSVGVSTVVASLLFDLVAALEFRDRELKSQEAIFWSSTGRAPIQYARTIALRFAKRVARTTGRKPTFGTARDGGHPSTDFGRALEEIFKVLDVGADVRNAAEWALGQLSEGDLKPLPINALSGLLFGDTRGLHRKNSEDALFQAMLGKGS